VSAAAGSHRLPAASADADAGLVHHAAQTGASCRSMGAKAYGVLPMGVSKTWGRLLAHLWLVGTGSVVFTSLRFAFACSGTIRYVTPAPVVRHQPAPGF
jgi:hypothetical protein